MNPSNDRNSLLLRRALAFLLDSVLLGSVQGLVLLGAFFSPLLAGLREGGLDRLPEKLGENPALFLGVIVAYVGSLLFFFLFTGFYFCLLQSSSWQATLGKRLLGLKITDMKGDPIGFGTAFVRYLIRALLSATGVLTLIDYVIGFTNEEGQTIHDLAAKTLVMDAKNGPPHIDP
jgi:uncharacterized RDD family membrane protein YckC